LGDFKYYLFAKPRDSVLIMLGIGFGVIMPIVSAYLYPTYTNLMPEPWVETTRLLEFPFIAAELLVVLYTMRLGLSIERTWLSLSFDIKIASVVLILGLFASSIFISQRPLYSLSMSLANVVHIWFAFSVAYLIQVYGDNGRKQFLLWLGVGLIFLTFYIAWRFAFAPDPSQVRGGMIRWDNAIPGFISVRHFGSWTGAIAAAFSIRILYFEKDSKLNIHHFFYFLAAALTVWSGTRAAVLSMIFVLVVIVVTLRSFPRFRAIGIATFLTILALVVASLLAPDHPAFLLYQSSDSESVSSMMSSRDKFWAATFYRWLDSPLWGWGSGSTFWEIYNGWTHTQPHNAILQFLITWGIVGTIGALWLLARAIHASHKSAGRFEYGIVLLAMLYSLLFQSLFEGMLHYPRFIIAIMMLFAIIIVGGRNPNTNGQKASL